MGEYFCGPGTKIDDSAIVGYEDIIEPRDQDCDVALVLCYTVIQSEAIIREGAIIYTGCQIGHETMIGHHTVIREATIIGDHCRIGHHTVLEGAIQIGDHTTIHSQCHICAYSKIGSYVFMAPFIVTTNDPAMSHRRKNIFKKYRGVTILDGARIGAGCTILPGITIGTEAVVGAGSIVTKDVPDYKIVYGSPARVQGIIPDNELLKNNGVNI